MELSKYDAESIDVIISGHGDWFSAYLIRLICKADINNLRLLHSIYPDHVDAVIKYKHGKNNIADFLSDSFEWYALSRFNIGPKNFTKGFFLHRWNPL